METYHLTAGARASLPLVRDDDDRRELTQRVDDALGALLLADCVMDTHLHVVAEGPSAHLTRWLDHALGEYARSFNRRHRGQEVLLRGPCEAFVKHDAIELARAIHYVHENPCRGERPLTERAIDYPWSSARAFAGLSLAALPSVGRANALMGAEAWRALKRHDRIALADVEPQPVPFAPPEVLLAAAAQTYGIAPARLPSTERTEVVARARALFLRLGKLEAYTLLQLAPYLERGQPRCTRLLQEHAVPDVAIAIARTLVRDTRLRAWLTPIPRRAHTAAGA